MRPGITGVSGAAARHNLERLQKREQRVIWPIPARIRRGGRNAGKRLFLQAQIRVHVHLGSFDRFMSEPERDDRLIDAVMQQFHRGAVTQNMRTHPLSGQRRTRFRCSQRMPVDHTLQRVATEFGALHGREQGIVGNAAALLEPDIKEFDDLLSQRRGTLFPSFTFTANVRAGSGHDVATMQVDDLRGPEPSLKREVEHGMIAPSHPSGSIRSSQQRVHLRAIQKLNRAPHVALARHCQNLLAMEVEQFIKVLQQRESVIAHLAIFCGMRPGEILALQRRHIATDCKRLSIDQRVYRGDIDTPKTHSSTRTVAIPPKTANRLKEWMELVNNNPNAWVFASENASKPMWRDNVWYRHMKPLLDPLGLSWATFQVLRRTHASLGHDAGIDPKVSADQRGHGIGVAIDVYTKAALSRRAEAAEQLENAVLTA